MSMYIQVSRKLSHHFSRWSSSQMVCIELIHLFSPALLLKPQIKTFLVSLLILCPALGFMQFLVNLQPDFLHK